MGLGHLDPKANNMTIEGLNKPNNNECIKKIYTTPNINTFELFISTKHLITQKKKPNLPFLEYGGHVYAITFTSNNIKGK